MSLAIFILKKVSSRKEVLSQQQWNNKLTTVFYDQNITDLPFEMQTHFWKYLVQWIQKYKIDCVKFNRLITNVWNALWPHYLLCLLFQHHPSKNFGNSFPKSTFLSRPSLVIAAILITPPDEPSRDIANDTAVTRQKLVLVLSKRVKNKKWNLTISDKLKTFIFSHSFFECSITMPINICTTRACTNNIYEKQLTCSAHAVLQ